MGRSHKTDFPSGVEATYARRRPSGESANPAAVPEKMKLELTIGLMYARATGASVAGRLAYRTPRVTAAAAVTTNAAIVNHSEFLRSFTGVAALDCEPASAIHFSSSATSRAVCQRSSGSFARQRRMARSSAGGVIGFTVLIGAAS